MVVLVLATLHLLMVVLLLLLLLLLEARWRVPAMVLAQLSQPMLALPKLARLLLQRLIGVAQQLIPAAAEVEEAWHWSRELQLVGLLRQIRVRLVLAHLAHLAHLPLKAAP